MRKLNKRTLPISDLVWCKIKEIFGDNLRYSNLNSSYLKPLIPSTTWLVGKNINFAPWLFF